MSASDIEGEPQLSRQERGLYKGPKDQSDQDTAVAQFKQKPSLSVRDSTVSAVLAVGDEPVPETHFRLYKQRFAGLVGLFLLNVAGGMGWPWFGPIANNMAAEFNISLDQVNWLGNIFSLVYLPTAILVPLLVARWGIRISCMIGSGLLLVSAWIRYGGTPHSLSTNGAYALLVLGQCIAAGAQPIFQILGPKYSETWFDLRGRTTATMIISIANPIGGALGQLISPEAGDTRQSILVYGIICTVISPFVFLIGEAPPTPPTFSASKKDPTLKSLCHAMLGLETSPETHMSLRERIDFIIMTLVFGVLVGVTNTFSILSNQYLGPVGYSSDISGLMGATLLLSGIVAAIVTAPLFDRVLTRHLALTAKVFCPCLAAAWLSLIWAVKPHDTGGLFTVMVIVGVTSITMLPVGLELGCEITRNADGSSAILWFSGNLFALIFILVEGALRAGPDADPPLNMHRALIFNCAFVCGIVAFIPFFKGKQARRELDEEVIQGGQR